MLSVQKALYSISEALPSWFLKRGSRACDRMELGCLGGLMIAPILATLGLTVTYGPVKTFSILGVCYANKQVQKIAAFGLTLFAVGAFRICMHDLAQGARCARGDAVVTAAQNGDQSEVDRLLQRGPLRSHHRGQAVEEAAQNGHEGIVMLLLNNGRIWDHYRSHAAQGAAENGHESIVRLLLNNGEISEFCRSHAAQGAAQNGHESIVRLLLNNGEISESCRGWVLFYAARNGHLAIIRQLLRDAQGDFIPMNIGMALLRAVSDGRRDVVEALLANVSSIPFSVHGSAITQATGEHREDIQDMLSRVLVVDDGSVFDIDDQPVSFEQRQDQEGERVSLAEIQDAPLPLLGKIASTRMPRCFYLKEGSRAIDLGGITKQVVTVLVDALINKKLLKMDAILRLPILEEEDAATVLQQFGQFLCKLDHCNRDRSDKVLIGARWSPELFALLQLEEGASTTDILVRLIKEERNSNYDVYATLLQDVTNPEALEIYTAYGFDNWEEAKADFLKWRESIEAAVKALRSGLTDEFKGQLRGTSAKAFSDQIQGVEASAETIIAAFKLEVPAADKVARFHERVEWLKEWILGADEKDRKNFLMAITSRNVLDKETKIKIKWGLRADGLVELHTCFNSFDLPDIDELTRDQFFAMVTGISGGKTSYNIA